MFAEGGVPVLCSVLAVSSSSDDTEKSWSARAIASIAQKSDGGAAAALAAGAMPALVLHLGAAGSGDATRACCAIAVCRITEKSDGGAAAALGAGAMPLLVLHLGASGSDEQTRASCAVAIGTIAHKSDGGAAAALAAGAMQALVLYLGAAASSGSTRANCAFAIGRIAENSSGGTAAALSAGAMPALVLYVGAAGSDYKMRSCCAFALVALGMPLASICDASLVAALVRVVEDPGMVSVNKSWRVGMLADVAERVDGGPALLLAAGAVQALVALLPKYAGDGQTTACHAAVALGALARRRGEPQDAVLAAGAVAALEDVQRSDRCTAAERSAATQALMCLSARSISEADRSPTAAAGEL